MSPTPGRPDLRHLISVPKFLGPRPNVVHPIEGTTPLGDSTSCLLGHGWTLLLFLSTSCEGCHELWRWAAEAVRKPVATDLSTLVVTRSAPSESPETVARLGAGACVVMSDRAWTDYEVHSGPFFVLIDGEGGRLATEGVAWSVAQIVGALSAARARS